MARTALPVDRKLFEQAVTEAEANGPLSKQSELFAVVAEKYNALDSANKISPAVAKLRIEGWAIPLKTEKARVFKKSNDNQEKPKTEKAEKVESVVPEPVDAPKGVSVEMQRRMLATGSCGCGFMNIIAPAGHCPVKLTGTDEETVTKWAAKVIEAGHKIARHFSMRAVKYYAREFFDCYEEPEKLRTVLQHLESIGDKEVFYTPEPPKKAVILEEESLEEVKQPKTIAKPPKVIEPVELGEESIDF